MNKPIIIDGVDVSECEYCIYAGAEFPECRIRLSNFEIKCEGYNCYFKQLQRLKAENEELKEELKQLHNGRTTEELYTLFGKPIKCWLEYKQALEEVREIANEPCIDDEDCETCNENCMSKDIINKINKVLKDE